MKKKFKYNLVLVGVILLLIQVIPVKRNNPATPHGAEIDAHREIQMIFETSCYDCHSHKTNWPWYSYVAPVSWVIAWHVKEGREHLNFSKWNTLNYSKRKKLREEIWEEVEEGEMPQKGYAPLHPGAALSSKEKNFLKKWSEISD